MAPDRPILLVDVDGVLALFNLAGEPPLGVWHLIEGFPYYLATETAALLHEAAEHFDLVWCTGWEDRANDHLPRLLGTPGPLPVVYFDRNPGRGNAHWKLAAIEAFSAGRAVAWIDDALNDECIAWAADRTAAGIPTLLVQTEPHRGFERGHLDALISFAGARARLTKHGNGNATWPPGVTQTPPRARASRLQLETHPS